MKFYSLSIKLLITNYPPYDTPKKIRLQIKMEKKNKKKKQKKTGGAMNLKMSRSTVWPPDYMCQVKSGDGDAAPDQSVSPLPLPRGLWSDEELAISGRGCSKRK